MRLGERRISSFFLISAIRLPIDYGRSRKSFVISSSGGPTFANVSTDTRPRSIMVEFLALLCRNIATRLYNLPTRDFCSYLPLYFVRCLGGRAHAVGAPLLKPRFGNDYIINEHRAPSAYDILVFQHSFCLCPVNPAPRC